VARMGERRGAADIWCGDLRDRDEFEGLCVDGRTILKLIFEKWDGGVDWIDLARDLAGCFEYDNEISVSIKLRQVGY